jgi:hypothetical protein
MHLMNDTLLLILKYQYMYTVYILYMLLLLTVFRGQIQKLGGKMVISVISG